MFQQKSLNLVGSSGGGVTRSIGAVFVTGNFFQTLQVQPALGRSLTANDDQPGHEQVALISDEFWHSQWDGRHDALGSRIQLNRKTYTVIGVMPKDFGYPFDGDVPYDRTGFKQADIWLPIAFSVNQKSDRSDFASATAIGRLKPGTTIAAAQAELQAIEARLQPLYPPMWRGWTVLLKPLVETIIGPVQEMFWLLLAAVAVVLVIALSNVAGLLLARTTARAHELGIRTALGAQRARIIRLLLTESLLLSCTGGILGIALAYALLHLLIGLNPGGIPRFDSASLDARALALAVFLSLAAGVAAGLFPAISASRPSISDLLKRGGSRVARGSHRGRHALIVLEVTLSVVLLTGSGLVIRSYLKLQAVDPGFSPSTLTLTLDLDEHYATAESQTAFYQRYLEKLQSLPGLKYVGASNSLPLTNHDSMTFAEIRGFGASSEMVETRSITPDYRKALGTPLLRGRDFSLQEVTANSPVVIINAKFAEMYFHGRDPLGGQVRTGIGDLSKSSWLTVIGVVGDVRHMAIDVPVKPQMFQPASVGNNFAIRSALPARLVAGQARGALRSLDPTLTLDIKTMHERIQISNARRTFQTSLLTGFAVIAVALALVGLYGLMAYTVKQRTSEIGIRLAIGSPRGRVLSLILSQGLRLTTYGLLIGLTASFALTRLVSGWLFAVQSTDPLTFALVPLLLLVVSCGACLIPAWGATQIDPIQTLRQE
jgi:putative ABC transport system permease protein